MKILIVVIAVVVLYCSSSNKWYYRGSVVNSRGRSNSSRSDVDRAKRRVPQGVVVN